MLIWPTLAVMILLGLVEPLSSRHQNRVEIFNNFMILVMSYCLISFTDYAPDPEARYTMGYGLVVLTIFNIVVNVWIVG